MRESLVVIGGTAAGLSAASKAKRIKPDISVAVFEKSSYVSYGACGLPYFIGGLIKSTDDLISFTPKRLGEERGVRAFIQHEVTVIDPADKIIKVRDLIGKKSFIVSYDSLVIATGALPIIPDIPNVSAPMVYSLRTLEDGIAIRNAVITGEVKKVVITGGGFIGLEVAEQLSLAGLEVTLIEAMPKLLQCLDEDYSEIIMKTLNEQGIHVYTDTKVNEIILERNKAAGVITSDGVVVHADMVIMATGVRPNSKLAMDAGLKTGYKDAISVDEYMKTSDDSIWACGDCVQTYHLVTKKETYMPLGTTANKQGRIVGGNIAGQTNTFKGILGSQVTKVFDLYVTATGITLHQAKEIGYEAESIKISKRDKASYYPGGKDNKISLIFDRREGTLLGGQAVGSESVVGRMNVLAAAITAGMTVKQLNEIDFMYSPPVAPVYDPLLIAAGEAIKKLKLIK